MPGESRTCAVRFSDGGFFRASGRARYRGERFSEPTCQWKTLGQEREKKEKPFAVEFCPLALSEPEEEKAVSLPFLDPLVPACLPMVVVVVVVDTLC